MACATCLAAVSTFVSADTCGQITICLFSQKGWYFGNGSTPKTSKIANLILSPQSLRTQSALYPHYPYKYMYHSFKSYPTGKRLKD